MKGRLETPGPSSLQHRIRTVMRRGCLSLLAFGVLGEAGTRGWDQLHGGQTGSLYDAVVSAGSRFKMRPGATVVVPERYGTVVYRFNRSGYRDAEPATGPDVRRLVLLGDSVSFGLGVEQERIYAARLERRLRRELRQPWEIDNLAIFAYHTGNELETLATDGLRLRPELVLVQFYMNDLATPAGPPGAPPPPAFGDRLIALKNRLLYRSALYRRLHQAALGMTYVLFHDLRRRFPGTLNDAEPRGDLAYLAAHPDDETVPAFRALRRIRDIAGAHGARTFVLVSPDEVQLFTGRFDEIDRRITGFCRRQGIELYDALPDLRQAPERARLYLDGVHLSPRGHARMADLLFRELTRRSLAPPRRRRAQ